MFILIKNVYDDEVPKVVTIQETIIETPTVKTFVFPFEITEDIHPGQFVMVWDLTNEKPMDERLKLLCWCIPIVSKFTYL